MAYRRTENVIRRLAARHDDIVAAARAAAGDGGMAAVQIAPVAERAGIAAGTVYRYFPGKTELIAALLASESDREIAALRRAATRAPGPLSALAAAIAAFAARALRQPRLAWALVAEPVEAEIDAIRLTHRRALAREIEALVRAAMAGGHLPDQDWALAVPAVLGALLDGLAGPLAPPLHDNPAKAREAAQTLTLFALRGLGVVDARARGLVVQATVPADDGAART
jgi:AcrR family transcriptional regulator